MLEFEIDCGGQGKSQLLPPAPPYYPFPRGKSILGVIYEVLLWADINAATLLGVRERSVISPVAVGERNNSQIQKAV